MTEQHELKDQQVLHELQVVARLAQVAGITIQGHGWGIEPQYTGIDPKIPVWAPQDSKCCCVLGAYLLGRRYPGRPRMRAQARELLGVSKDYLNGIISAFDGMRTGWHENESEYYRGRRIGAQLREEFLP